MLFLPWRTEDELLQSYTSYVDRYHSEIDRIKVIENMFIHQEEDINNTFEHLQVAGPPQAVWDNLAPDELAHDEGVSDEHPMAEEDIQAHIDQIVKELLQSQNESLSLKYTKEARKGMLSTQEYNKCMQQLNKEQKIIVMYHRKWCKETVHALEQNKPVKPYCLFLSGPVQKWRKMEVMKMRKKI